MNLLYDIRNAAIDSSLSLSVVLRKCLVLASALNNAELKRWINNELNGYNTAKEVPNYRTHKVISNGYFSGITRDFNNLNIPMSCLNNVYQKALEVTRIQQSVAALENMVKTSDGEIFKELWHPDIVADVGANIYENMNCLKAWKLIPKDIIVSTLDCIRNKTLEFALEIEATSPDLDSISDISKSLPAEQVQQIFHTTIFGDVQNVAIGGNHVEQHAHIAAENSELFENLLNELANIKPSTAEVKKIVELVNEMQTCSTQKGYIEKYTDFISLLSKHIQVFGPIVADYLPQLSEISKSFL